ncbi:MAG: hypothetical protein OEX08_00005, partial [Candidatus Nomurabacteria bacterium]|nr:hypothetical protein [Candidatus Nomurabacteria bacterium]
YKTGVADYMIAEYRSGRTPNPDVMCNREVKFGGFLDWALERGADFVATGHYAQVTTSSSPDAGEVPRHEAEGYQKTNTPQPFGLPPYIGGQARFQLLRGIDPGKDQSYFLWTLTQDQLKHILFPVGHLIKDETRKLAEKYELPTATKKDSQGVCFIGEIDMKEFLGHYINHQPGDVLNTDGKIIGHHDGALFFTLGERHGFTILSKGTDESRYYVVDKDIKKNTITVSENIDNQKENYGKGQQITITNINMISEPLRPGQSYDAQIRYHGEIKKMTLSGIKGDTASVVLAGHDATIAPGQSLVIYLPGEQSGNGDICLGGGVIDSVA